MVGARPVVGYRAFIGTFERQVELQVPGADVLGFHGSPSSYDDMILATTPHEELLRLLDGCDQPLLLGGHSHVQLVRVIEGRLLVNPGSIGLPFRGVPLGEPQPISPWAEYALVRIDNRRVAVDLRRTRYDVEGMLRYTTESGAPYAFGGRRRGRPTRGARRSAPAEGCFLEGALASDPSGAPVFRNDARASYAGRGDTTRVRRRSGDVVFARKASGRHASMKLARAAGMHRIPK